ncbi:peroxiredoxin [Cesiribacter andamanensis]|uniref:thioredoxin-dependent peroxiredoxin n=1 Tax=Cesiribacter andamanensis AMV16 TaxID=1279009 RepID=M7N1I2_9BACT|nr:peroxiredoxin [Cesiribacter andamanensis]EMR02543.1 Putative peroxiredoxin bcp [Cesiribacter andamanensis AMV16]
MALKATTPAPDFTLPSTEGPDFTLSQTAAGKPLILYFYPKDFTRGCTKEACEFRDQFEFFRKQDIPVWGISRDSVETHHRFRQHHKLPFHLLADEQGTVASLYKATVPLLPLTLRVTYLLDKHHTIVGVYDNMFGAEKHIQQMIDTIRQGSHAADHALKL